MYTNFEAKWFFKRFSWLILSIHIVKYVFMYKVFSIQKVIISLICAIPRNFLQYIYILEKKVNVL